MQDIRKLRVCVNTMVNVFYAHSLMAHVAKTGSSPRLPQARECFRQELEEYGKKMLEAYADAVFTYLIIAIAGEVRNLDVRNFKIPKSPVKTKRVIEKLTEAGVRFGGNDDRDPTQKGVLQYFLKAKAGEVTDFLEAAVEAFKHWKGSDAFGGRPWKIITQTALKYAEGKMDRLRFLDTVFTLVHHGGEMFDKHASFAKYTDEGALKDQLEVQSKAKNIGELIKGLAAFHKKFDTGLIWLLRRGATMGYWRRRLADCCEAQDAIREKKMPTGKKKGPAHA